VRQPAMRGVRAYIDWVGDFWALFFCFWARGGIVVKALRYKPAGRGFDSRWRHWNFSVT
jgi:hypothetical protein